MNKDVFLSLLRTVLTAGGAWMVGHNILTTTIDTSLWQEIVGAIILVGSTIWGVIDKTTTIEAIQSAIRSILAVGGGILVAAGKISGDKLEAIGGMIIPILTFIYSYSSKKKNEMIADGKLAAIKNPIGDKVSMKKTASIIIVVLISQSLFSQSLFKPIPKPKQNVSIKAGATNPLVQNSVRPLAGVTASLFGDGTALAGGAGAGFQHNVWDAPSEKWVTQYSISGLLFLDTKAAVVGGLLFGVAGGIIQVGPGYDFNAKRFVLLTGFGIPFN